MSERDLFIAALKVPDLVARAAWLDQECSGDATLRQRIDVLLQAFDNAGSLLEKPVVGPGATIGEPAQGEASGRGTEPVSEAPGTVIGPYKLLQQIGEGGMGTVFMAEQTEPVQRKVALKLIKSGMDSRQVIARFEAERQALALMDHPNIARVLDAGTTASGRPYFVMELVKGVPITKYCDEHHLTPRQRLELFVPVCQAVQHAHQKGIIHRDLKPSNVMVCLYDGKPVPKVIDFGVAKAAGPRLTEKTLFTEIGQVVGTLEYMSPEQAELNQLDIDTRSDIYSLGVLLYELLTGTTPLERKRFQAVAFLEVLRLIREEESPRPSTRLSTAEGLPSIAANRGLEPKKLSGLMRGELDWIVMKTLEKDRNRRYETANGLAMDVQRYLADEAVQACPPSARYRLKKFLRRNKGPVLAASLVLLALVVGVIGTTLGLLEAQASQEQAEQEAINAGKERDAATKAREAESVQRQRAEAARDRAADTLDAMTSNIVGDALIQQKAITPEQKQFLTTALEYYRELLKEKASDQATQYRIANAELRVGHMEFRLGRKREATILVRQARDDFAKLAREFPTDTESRSALAVAHNHLGVLWHDLGKEDEARAEYRAAIGLYEELAAQFPADPRRRFELARTHHNLGAVLRDVQPAEAEIEFRAALNLRKILVADFPALPNYRDELAATYFSLATLLRDLGKWNLAMAEIRAGIDLNRQLVREYPASPAYRAGLARAQTTLGSLWADVRKWDQAEAEYRAAEKGYKNLAVGFPLVADYRDGVATCRLNLGIVLDGLGKREEAEMEFRASVAIREQLVAEFPMLPTYRRDLADSHLAFAGTLAAWKKSGQARTEYRAASAIFQQLVTEFPTAKEYAKDLGGCLCELGKEAARGGRPKDALPWFDQAIATLTPVFAAHPKLHAARKYLHNSHWGRARALDSLKRYEEAETGYRAVLALDKQLVVDFPAVPDYRTNLAENHGELGLVLLAWKKWDRAETELRAAAAIHKQLMVEFPEASQHAIRLAGTFCNLGFLARDCGRPNDALPWFDRAIATLSLVVGAEPKSVLALRFLFNSRFGRAGTLDVLKRNEQAAEEWARAMILAPEKELTMVRCQLMLSRVHAGQFEAALKDADQLAKGDAAGLIYDCACAYGLVHARTKDDKHALRAVELLRRAVAKGYRDAAHMTKDTDLDSLRARADFKKLMAELEKGRP